MAREPRIAEEVVDGVLVKIWTDGAKFGEVKSPRNWIYTVAVNTAKNALRRERNFSGIFDVPSFDENIGRVESDDAFFGYIGGLSEDERKIMIFRFVARMSFKEMSKELKMPQSTVSSLYYRALEKIKKKFF